MKYEASSAIGGWVAAVIAIACAKVEPLSMQVCLYISQAHKCLHSDPKLLQASFCGMLKIFNLT